MLLDEKEVFPIMHYWCSRYARQFKSVIDDKDELFNIVYLGKIQRCENIKFASTCIKQDIIDHLRYEMRRRKWVELTEYHEVETENVKIEFTQSLDKIINQAGLTNREQTILYLYYYKSYTMDQIADFLGLGKSAISIIHAKVLTHLQEIGDELYGDVEE